MHVARFGSAHYNEQIQFEVSEQLRRVIAAGFMALTGRWLFEKLMNVVKLCFYYFLPKLQKRKSLSFDTFIFFKIALPPLLLNYTHEGFRLHS